MVTRDKRKYLMAVVALAFAMFFLAPHLMPPSSVQLKTEEVQPFGSRLAGVGMRDGLEGWVRNTTRRDLHINACTFDPMARPVTSPCPCPEWKAQYLGNIPPGGRRHFRIASPQVFGAPFNIAACSDG